MNWLREKYYASQIIYTGVRWNDQDLIRIGVEVLFNASISPR